MWDSAYPNNYDEDAITIMPQRNPGQPQILNVNNLQKEIWDTHAVGETIIQVNATDADGVSTKWF